MKTTILTCLCSIALFLPAFGQSSPTPAPSPSASGTAVASAIAGASISPAVTATPDDEDSIEKSVKRKTSRKFSITSPSGITVTRRHHDNDDFDVENGALMAIPIIGIIFSTLFGAPVLVVGAIMFFSYLKSRSLHRTVREHGGKRPASAARRSSARRPRSAPAPDMRRGVVLVMVGIGVMIFFGAVNDWDGGAWSLGMIPFLIGAGYLLVWKLEGRKDKVPPLP